MRMMSEMERSNRDVKAEEARDSCAIELEHVSKAFGEQKILDDVSFRIDRGKAFCLLGRSGMGKSVTLKILVGLIPPEAGRVLVEGCEIVHSDRRALAELRKRIGFLFQNGALFDSISVAENVAFPLRRHTDLSEEEIQSAVREKLEQVELEGEGDKMPSELSGGMNIRAGLARALVLKPKVLLIDEPSSGLDRITARGIYDMLAELKKAREVTMVVVTHDVIGAREFVDEFGVLDKGKIVSRGSFDDLAEGDNPLARDLAAGSET